MKAEGWDGTDVLNEEMEQPFRSAKPPLGALDHPWDIGLSVEG